MLKNAYFLAKIGADTAEYEGNVAEILPKKRVASAGASGRGSGVPSGTSTASGWEDLGPWHPVPWIL